jgi:hypothetical protein
MELGRIVKVKIKGSVVMMKMDKDNEGAKNIVTSIKKFSAYSKLRKAALMVVAHQSQSIEITKMRNGK